MEEVTDDALDLPPGFPERMKPVMRSVFGVGFAHGRVAGFEDAKQLVSRSLMRMFWRGWVVGFVAGLAVAWLIYSICK